jgi:hypothetical protein
VGESGFVVLAPARCAGRKSALSEGDGSDIEASVETASAIAADFSGFELVIWRKRLVAKPCNR